MIHSIAALLTPISLKQKKIKKKPSSDSSASTSKTLPEAILRPTAVSASTGESGRGCTQKDVFKVAKIGGVGLLLPLGAFLILYLMRSNDDYGTRGSIEGDTEDTTVGECSVLHH